MKLQGLSVVCVLIVLPLILVLTYYIQLQVDTITLQNAYDSKLLDSTYDAMSAFEINTANEDLSTVSDSLRTIIEASSNVFFSTLATNMGMSNASKSYLEPYIPSLLYTLYDGYYINAPTQVPTVLTDTDGNAVSVGDIGVSYNKTSNSYSYRIIHYSPENQENCSECIQTGVNAKGHPTFTAAAGHTLYDYEHPNTQDTSYYMTEDEIEELAASGKDQYGQILYLKKGETDEYTTNLEEAEFKTKNVLKTYMPYSAKYQKTVGNTTYDFSVVYTLDNYVTIEGSILKDDKDYDYITKSGYLLPKLSSEATVSCVDVEPAILLQYNQNDAQRYIEDGYEVKVKIGDIEIVSNSGRRKEDLEREVVVRETRINNAYNIYRKFDDSNADSVNNANNFLNGTAYTYTAGDIPGKLAETVAIATKELNDFQYELDKMSANVYYTKGAIFSNWVYTELKYIQEKDLVEISGTEYKAIKGKEEVIHDFSTSIEPVFDIVGSTSEGIVEISKDSTYYTHKLNVIRNSIQYNLNNAMSTYNSISSSTDLYAMPVLANEEWERILTHPSIVSFMQGYSCGLKKYNNYMIVSSVNNELAIVSDNVYFSEITQFSDEQSEYHRVDCPRLYTIDEASTRNEYMSFSSKDVKYDKIEDRSSDNVVKYDHRNLACYECINDGNYIPLPVFNEAHADYAKYSNLRKAYYIGLGKCRNNLYKMNAFENSQGYQVIYDKNLDEPTRSINIDTRYSVDKIKALEIVFGPLKTRDPDETVLNYMIELDGTGTSISLGDDIHSIASNVTTFNTIYVEVKPDLPASFGTVNIDKLNYVNQAVNSTIYDPNDASAGPREAFRNAIIHIRAIYK